MPHKVHHLPAPALEPGASNDIWGEEPPRSRFVSRDRSRGLSTPSRPWPAEGHPPSDEPASSRPISEIPYLVDSRPPTVSPGARSELWNFLSWVRIREGHEEVKPGALRPARPGPR